MGATSQASRGRLRGRLSAPWCGYSASHCASIAGFGTLAGSLHRPGQSGGEFWGRGIWELESGSARAVDSELDLGLGDLGGGNEAVVAGGGMGKGGRDAGCSSLEVVWSGCARVASEEPRFGVRPAGEASPANYG